MRFLKSVLLTDVQLQIGFMTQQRANSLLQEGFINSQAHSSFYIAVRSFFEKAVEYNLKTLPLDDELLKAATFLNFEERVTVNFMQVEYFINRYV